MSKTEWTPDQLRAIETRGSSVLVSAAAGSGKTAVLVERLLRRITEEKLDITQFLIITYTKAAASELRRKISDALSEYSAAHPGDRHIRRQCALVGSARISTVHSFCTWVLRNFSEFSELSSGFRVLDDGEGELILEEELKELIDEKYDSGDSGFLALADYLSGARNDKQLFGTVLELYKKSISHPYPEKWLSYVEASYDVEGVTSIKDTPWGEYAFRAAYHELGFNIETLKLMIADVEKRADSAELYSALLYDELSSLSRAICDDWDEMRNALLSTSFSNLPSSKKLSDRSVADRMKEMHKRVKEDTAAITEKFLSDSSDRLLFETHSLLPHVKRLVALTNELADRFKKEKLRRGVLDYSDLEHFTISLLVENYDEKEDKVTPSAAADEISKLFSEILLDEFQDSNNVQDIIFRAVSREEKNIVMVGDVKQSIYRFRLADPSIFMKKYKTFKKYEDAVGDEPRCITLSQNFRSRAEVLEASNALFSRIMSEKLGDVDYTQEHYLVPRKGIPDAGENDMSCEFHLIDREGERGGAAEAEASFVAKKIAELVSSGFEICDKSGERRRVHYRDFAILLRSVSGNAAIYEQELRQQGIPYISPRADGLLTKSEVNAIVAYLSVIDNPTSDIQLLATLRSPLFAFSADDLCRIRRAGKDSLIYAMESLAKKRGETAEKCRSFLSELSALRSLSRGMSASSLIWELYNRTNALGVFGAMPYGDERQRNLIEFYRCAGAFESSGYSGLYKFISHIARLAEQGGDIPAPVAHSSDAVTIMTIHKSKGLEFPVVFLSGAIRNFNTDDIRRPVLVHPELGIGLRFRDEKTGCDCPTLSRDIIADAIVNEMKSEEMRVLYVAMTRAREKLYIVSSHSNPEKMIKQTLLENSYSELDSGNLTSRMGTQTWFMLPILRTATGASLLGEAESGAVDMGETLGGMKAYLEFRQLSAEPCEEIPEESEQGEKDDPEELLSLLDFKYGSISATKTPSKVTATGLGASESELGFLPRRRTVARPGFMKEQTLSPAEKGTALHMAMQFADFEKCGDRDGAEKELSRMLSEKYLTQAQVSAVDADKIVSFVASDIGGEMRAAKEVVREFKFSVLLPADEMLKNEELSGEKVLLQGVMDMYYETEEGLTIVDFKTDRRRPEGETLEGYTRQLHAYRRALFEMTGKTAEKLVLYLVATGEYIKV